MPIQAENRDRYPKDWPQISGRVREAAGFKCEFCGVRNGDWGWRDKAGKFHVESARVFPKGYRPPFDWGGLKIIRIVLTVAHLDNRPENCAPENLRALCQRCHLGIDRKHHLAVQWVKRHRAMRTLELPL